MIGAVLTTAQYFYNS